MERQAITSWRQNLLPALFAMTFIAMVALPAAELTPKSLPLPGENFAVQNHAAFVIPPATSATTNLTPWVWYAPTLQGLPGSEEKWMFEKFTQAGIAIAGIDVGESYGNPEGRKLYTALYNELTQHRGFAPRPVMLARSRGGLMALSWAEENANKVAAIAGIYPVCDLASYPGLTNAAPAYQQTPDELAAHLSAHNPVDRLAPLATAGVPLFAIHGDRDTKVPLAANSAAVRERYKALRGHMQLVVVNGQGHNMWPGFFQSPELVGFVLKHATNGMPPDSKAELTIHLDQPSKPYSPMIFGGFLEHFDHQIYGGVFEPGSPLADKNGFRKDVIKALRELKVPVVRWPGGCYASGYHWESGVGKVRQPTDDMAWGVIEPNTFGTHEFVQLCRMLDWKPYICNNAGNGTVAEMRNWVEYCNSKTGPNAERREANGYRRPQTVKIWSIGNENWGAHEIGHKSIEQWSPLVLEAAQAMKAADPTISLTAAALPTREWTLPLLKQAGPYLDYISIHKYWLPFWNKNEMPDYRTCIMHSESPERFITNFVGVLDESGYRGRIKIAFDEWNLRGWHHEGFPRRAIQKYDDPEVIRLVAAREKNDIPSQYTMADALFSASFFNACLRHAEDIGMANIAPLVNTRGPLYVHAQGIVKRPHFHTMALYANQLESQVSPSTLHAAPLVHDGKSIPVMDAIATVNESGRHWAIALVNRDPENPVSCVVKLGEKPLHGRLPATILAGDAAEAFNSVENPDRVMPRNARVEFTHGSVRLPPHSLTIVKLTRP